MALLLLLLLFITIERQYENLAKNSMIPVLIPWRYPHPEIWAATFGTHCNSSGVSGMDKAIGTSDMVCG